MLQTLREKTTGWVAVIIVGALAIPFAFVGIENYTNPPVGDYVAKVGEIEIGRNDFSQRFEGYVAQAQQMMGDSFRRELVDTPDARRRILDSMIDEALYKEAASQLGILVPASRLRDEIQGIPSLQVGGQFSPELYRQLLAARGMSAAALEAQLAGDIQGSILPESVATTAFVGPDYVDAFLRLRDQKRSFEYIELPAPELEEAPTEEALREFHANNGDRYRSQEQVSIEYVVVDPAAISVEADVAEDVLRQRYEEAGRRYVEPEQRLASHILFRVPQNADADTERAALEKAEAALARARAEGADFAALAKELSEDPGSKNTGGDLGWLERGFTDPAFEDALFQLEANTISEPIKSGEGWHIIQLREVRAEVAKPFEDVREEIKADYLAAERERLSGDLAGRLVDLLLKDPMALDQSASELGLEIQKAGPFGRSGGDEAITQVAAVQQAAFSADVLEDGLVSDVIDLGDGRRAALRVSEHLRAEVRPFEEVQEQVLADVRQDKIEVLAKTQAEAVLAELKGGAELASLAEPRGVEVQKAEAVTRSAFTVTPQVLQEAFRMQSPQGEAPQPVHAIADLGAGRHAVISLSSVEPGDPTAVAQAERDALRMQLSQAAGEAEVRALAAALRQRTEIVLADEGL